jgi:alpha-galactosidase
MYLAALPNVTPLPSQQNLQVNTTVFPNGIKPVADYIHSKGLKFGIYSDAGQSVGLHVN